VEVSATGCSTKSDRVLLVSVGSPMRSPASSRVVCAHFGLFYGSATASGCFEYASECTDFESEYESSESSESKLSSQEESMCIIISDRWKSEGVCMRLLRYMQDTFLELDTTLNNESV
jgi:hypothetical protein